MSDEDWEKDRDAIMAASGAAADAVKAAGARGVVVITLWKGHLYFDERCQTPLVASALAREAAYNIRELAAAETVRPGLANLDAMLAQMPEDERAEAKQAIEKMFKDGFPRGARATQALATGETQCPGCNEALRRIGAPDARLEDEPASVALECTGCGGSFSMPATVDA